jgi:hypothetical protein
MKATKRLMVVMVTALMMICCPIQAYAAAGGESTFDPDSAGLITSYTYSLSSGTSRVLLNASINASAIMAEIGFKDIKIQKSTSSTGSWSTYFAPSDQLATNSSSNSLYNFLISVPSGYYYRVQLTFYAKETGWFFPESESITVTTNTVQVLN